MIVIKNPFPLAHLFKKKRQLSAVNSNRQHCNAYIKRKWAWVKKKDHAGSKKNCVPIVTCPQQQYISAAEFRAAVSPGCAPLSPSACCLSCLARTLTLPSLVTRRRKTSGLVTDIKRGRFAHFTSEMPSLLRT